MKKLILIFCFLPILFSCQAQDKKWTSNWADSVGLASREVVDELLAKVDSINGVKIIYTLDNKDVYLIAGSEYEYKEYYISLNENQEIQEIRSLNESSEKELLKKAFDLKQYHSDFITSMPNAKYVRGKPSYFVVIDTNGKRHGEFALSSLTVPNPLDGDFYGYLTRRLSEEMSTE